MKVYSNPKLRGYIYISTAALIWGSNGVIVNSVPLSALTITFFRVFFASLTILVSIFLTQKWEILKIGAAWRNLFFLGVFLCLGWGLLFQAMKLISIADAVLLNYLAPIYVALTAPIFLKEKLSHFSLYALALSILGIILITSPQGFSGDVKSLMGTITGLFAGLAYAGFVILSKITLYKVSNYSISLYSNIFASIFLAPSLLGINMYIGINPWIFLITLGVVNTAIAVNLYFKGLNLVKAQEAVVLTYLEPTSAILFGYLVLFQQPTLNMIIGGSLILIAGYIIVSKKKK